MFERRKARSLDHFRLGLELLYERLQRRRAEQHRFLTPAEMQQAVGKDMTAFAIGGELRFVQSDEGEVALRPAAATRPAIGHRLDRAKEVAGSGRFDPLFAGDESNLRLTLDGDHPVIDFACEQPQGKTDRSARMSAHSLDREMGLAGIGRPEHRFQIAAFHADEDGIAQVEPQPPHEPFQQFASFLAPFVDELMRI